MRRHLWILPLAALLAVAPLLYANGTCANDIGFHLQSWYDAAAQLVHGTVYPRWTFAAAYNMGEPRFTFYPPISWQLGRLLYFVVPANFLPITMAWLALTLSGLAMLHLARQWVRENVAVAAAVLYLANPYMLFGVYHRSGYGELFASAACPLLFAAMLAPRLRTTRVAVALALLWLSDVPAAILGTYVFALFATYRLLRGVWQVRTNAFAVRRSAATAIMQSTTAFAAALGLSAVFLIPALAERRLVHMQDAFPISMRPVDNLLLHRTLLPGRDDFLISIAHIASAFAVLAVLVIAVLWRTSTRSQANQERWYRVGKPLAVMAVILLFSFSFFSRPFWAHLPALWATQFPWRGLYLLAVCLALAIALVLEQIPQRLPLSFFALLFTAASAILAGHFYRVRCPNAETPASFYALLDRHHSPAPTDEYVPAPANPGSYRPDNPPFWLTPDARSYASGTTPNLTDIDPEAEMPAAPSAAMLSATPLDVTILSPRAQFLVLNLEAYPHWLVALDGKPAALIPRPDGLIAFAVPAGTLHVTTHWHPGWEEYVGWAVSLATLLALFAPRKRRRSHDAA